MLPLFAGLGLRLYLLLFPTVVHSRLFSIASSFVALLLIWVVFISLIILMSLVVICGSSIDLSEVLSSSMLHVLPYSTLFSDGLSL